MKDSITVIMLINKKKKKKEKEKKKEKKEKKKRYQNKGYEQKKDLEHELKTAFLELLYSYRKEKVR